jgi:hypothetical protein
MRSLLVLAFVIQSVPARAQTMVSLFGGGATLVGSSQRSSADFGFTGGAAVGWGFKYLERVPGGPDLHLTWGPEIAVAYSHWGSVNDDLYALTVAPGIRAGLVKGAWTPGIGLHLGYVRGSEGLLRDLVSAALGSGGPTGSEQGIVFDFGAGLDRALGQRWVLRGEAVLHVGFSSGSATWITFGPSLGITL